MRRKLTGLVVAGAAVALAAAPAASAPPPGLSSYAAGANAYAVLLDAPVLDLALLASLTDAEVTSQPTATAGGGALVVADQVLGGPDDTCPLVLPPPIDAVVADIGCVTGTEEADADPRATAVSEEVVLDLGGAELTSQVVGPIRDALIEQLTPNLAAILDLLGLLGLPDLEQVLDDVLTQLVDVDGSAVRVTVAPTNSRASADDTGVLARSEAAGVIIEVVPGLTGTPVEGITSCAASQALLCAQISGSYAQVRRDPVTGAVDPEGLEATEAELLDFRLAPSLGTLLGDAVPLIASQLNDAVATLAEASPLACGVAGPLADLLCLDAAATDELDAAEAAAFGFDYGQTTVGARASALRVEVLPIAEGGIVLALNEAVAAAAAVPAQAPTTTAPPTTAPDAPGLARTGGSGLSPVLLLALGGLAVVGTVASRRAAAR